MVWRSHPWTVTHPLALWDAGRDPFDRWFGETLDRWFQPAARTAGPALDLWRDEESGDLVLEAEVPGSSPDDLELSVEGRDLTLRVKRGDVTTERRLRLPVAPDADAVEAAWNDGLLEVRLPAAAAERVRKIEIRTQG